MEICSWEEDDLHRNFRYRSSALFVAAALAAPMAVFAAAKPQNRANQEEHHPNGNDSHKVYDRNHKDYHNWDADEDRSYRQYLGEKHREYRPFSEASQKLQSAYWNWRHGHSDHEQNGS